MHPDRTTSRAPMALLLAITLLPAALLPAAPAAGLAAARQAHCVIRQNGVVAYTGRCTFAPEKGGSFSLRSSTARPLLQGISDLSVTVLSPGKAEVRGLTSGGVNSRWGSAARSQREPACWTGADFEICAY